MAGVAISFSLPGRGKRDPGENGEGGDKGGGAVTGVGGKGGEGKPVAFDDEDEGRETRAERASGGEEKVIPCQPDAFQVGSGKKLVKGGAGSISVDDVHNGSMEERWDKVEDEKAQGSGSGGEVTYGLSHRRRGGGQLQGGGGGAGSSSASMIETLQFKQDLAELPEDNLNDLERYEAMPVEDFGRAMLRGMGWVEGDNVGREGKNGEKKRIEAVTYVPRPSLLGLGAEVNAGVAKHALSASAKARGESGGHSSRRPNTQSIMTAAPGSDGRARHVVGVGEKLVKVATRGPEVGKQMFISGGRHADLRCTVVEINAPENRCRVRLVQSGEFVSVKTNDLHDVNLYLAGQEKKRKGESSKGGKDAKRSRTDVSSQQEYRREVAKWVRVNLRVRIVSKKIKNGCIYLKKGIVTDVPQPGVCSVSFESGDVAHAVDQKHIETVVPREAGAVLCVVRGNLVGELCRLVHRSRSEGTASVTLLSDFSFHTLDLDDVAEYVGPVEE